MTSVTQFRAAKDDFFGHDPSSPLTPDQRRSFEGLAYFPENPALRIDASAQEFSDKQTIQMQTSTGDVATYQRWGRISFEVDGQTVGLTLYQGAGQIGFFLPFTDALAGQETYGAGRYLEPELLAEGRVLVDFNAAYNPFCAYNANWNCPIPPSENRLAVPIRAGEKIFPGTLH